jgi:hypothetical protein
MSHSEKKRKPHPPKPIQGHEPPKKRQKKDKDAPETSAVSTEKQPRRNLTLHDWMTVFAYCDKQGSTVNQSAVVAHFSSLQRDALFFDQSTLSRKLKNRAQLEQKATAFPNALSSRRERVVTRPDVDRALSLWVERLRLKRETVNGPMLQAKRKWFEEQLQVPDEERLKGKGWVSSFCKA